MKTIFLLLFSAMIMAACATDSKQKGPQRVLRHVVLFKFTDASTPEDVKKVEDAFVALKGKIDLIKDFEWGVNNSPEKLNQALTHCFFVTFSSTKDRDAYLVHPAHKDFVTIAGSSIEKVTVVDYWVHK